MELIETERGGIYMFFGDTCILKPTTLREKYVKK